MIEKTLPDKQALLVQAITGDTAYLWKMGKGKGAEVKYWVIEQGEPTGDFEALLHKNSAIRYGTMEPDSDYHGIRLNLEEIAGRTVTLCLLMPSLNNLIKNTVQLKNNLT